MKPATAVQNSCQGKRAFTSIKWIGLLTSALLLGIVFQGSVIYVIQIRSKLQTLSAPLEKNPVYAHTIQGQSNK